MLKKLVYALALTGLASGQAFALTDAGFENANNWVTPIGGLTRVDYGSPQARVLGLRRRGFQLWPDRNLCGQHPDR